MLRFTHTMLTLGILAVVGCAATGQAASPQGGSPPARGGDSERRGEQEAGPKPYSEVIPDSAETDEGLFSVHKVDDKYFFEIPDSLYGRDMLLITRIAQVPDIRPLVRAQLNEIRTEAERASTRTRDRMTRYHLEDIVERINAILDGGASG